MVPLFAFDPMMIQWLVPQWIRINWMFINFGMWNQCIHLLPI